MAAKRKAPRLGRPLTVRLDVEKELYQVFDANGAVVAERQNEKDANEYLAELRAGLAALLPTVFVAMGPNCWGKGETVDVAAKNARKHLPGPMFIKPGSVQCIVYSVRGFKHVDDMGRIWYEHAGGVTEVARKTWRVTR